MESGAAENTVLMLQNATSKIGGGARRRTPIGFTADVADWVAYGCGSQSAINYAMIAAAEVIYGKSTA
jgi:hypothetical protein